MATIDFTSGVGGNVGLRAAGQNILARFDIDFSLADNQMGSGDTLQIFDVKVGTLVQGVGIKCLTAEGGTATIDVGDGSDPDGYIDGADINSTSTYVVTGSNPTEEAYKIPTANQGGKFYTSADTIDLLANNALDAAKIRVWIYGLDLS